LFPKADPQKTATRRTGAVGLFIIVPE